MSEQICIRSGKTRYTSAGAKRALRKVRERRGGPVDTCERRSYRCRDCGCYHLTSKPEPRGPRQRRIRGAFGDF